MTFTAGLLLVFLNVFLSGLIFLRFYFIGEFSKQFNTRVPIIRLAFYALIPGLIVFSLGIVIYSACWPKFELSQALEIYVDLLNPKGRFSSQTKHFLDYNLTAFVCYNLTSYAFAMFAGFLLHFLVQKTNLDKKSKLFRFKNTWYYVFSGEILKFKKFLNADPNLQLNSIEKKQHSRVTYADVLCEENGKSKLYTGYVVDYELDQENMHQLDRIYLLDAHRFDKNPSPSRIQGSFIRKDIHGHLFVIDYKNVINLNLTYVPSKRRKKDHDRQMSILTSRASLYFGTLLGVILVSLLWLGVLPIDTNWVENIFLSLTILGSSNVAVISVFCLIALRIRNRAQAEYQRLEKIITAPKVDPDKVIDQLKDAADAKEERDLWEKKFIKIRTNLLTTVVGTIFYFILFLIF